MATSSHEKISPIFGWLSQFREWGQNAVKWRCLDIGIGIGVMGYLWRAFMDIHCLRLKREDWVTKLDGIEIFEDYRNPVWDYAYDKVLMGNALNLIDSLGSYHFVFMCDVIEHFEREDGWNLLNEVARRTLGGIILSFPSHLSASATRKTAHYGNEYEKHLSVWRKEDFEKDFEIVHSSGGNLVILRKKGLASIEILKKELDHALTFREKWTDKVSKLREQINSMEE